MKCTIVHVFVYDFEGLLCSMSYPNLTRINRSVRMEQVNQGTRKRPAR